MPTLSNSRQHILVSLATPPSGRGQDWCFVMSKPLPLINYCLLNKQSWRVWLFIVLARVIFKSGWELCRRPQGWFNMAKVTRNPDERRKVMEQATPSTKQTTSTTKRRKKRKNPYQPRSRYGSKVRLPHPSSSFSFPLISLPPRLLLVSCLA